MEALKNLENRIARWYKSLPSLPDGARKTLAEYLWVLVIFAAVFYGLLLVVVLGLFAIPALSFMSVQSVDSGISAPLITLLLEIVLVLSLMIAAIGPLKKLQRSGWDKMFIVVFVTFLASMVQLLFNFSFYDLISAFAWLAVELYFLMQVKNYFTKK